MSSHGAFLSEEMIRALPSQVSKITQGLLLSIGIASTGISIAGEWSHGNHFLNEWLLENVTIVGSLLHLLLIVLVIFPGRVRLLNDDIVDPCAKTLIGLVKVTQTSKSSRLFGKKGGRLVLETLSGIGPWRFSITTTAR